MITIRNISRMKELILSFKNQMSLFESLNVLFENKLLGVIHILSCLIHSTALQEGMIAQVNAEFKCK